MDIENLKKETVCLVDVMIDQADKGASGFWVEDHEGCGNPKIFPEFKEGLKTGGYVRKEHYLCPWNTAILFANGRGNIYTGCYHSCSIGEARFLTTEKLKNVLVRFKEKLSAGVYDGVENIEPLLTEDECTLIERRKEAYNKKEEMKRKLEAQRKREAAERVMKRFKDEPKAQQFLAMYYGDNVSVSTYEYGCLQFSTDSMLNIVGGEKLTYDDYLELQIRSHGHQTRTTFELCYFEYGMEYCGQIEKKTRDKICFKRILVSGMYSDGRMFDGKEDHVWMDIKGFEDFDIDDSVSFFAEVYRYIKTGNGKVLDYGLRNPQNIKKIKEYTLPTDEELQAQAMREIICESCYLNEHCNQGFCILGSSSEKEDLT